VAVSLFPAASAREFRPPVLATAGTPQNTGRSPQEHRLKNTTLNIKYLNGIMRAMQNPRLK
jgi:hypothetical protein